MTQVHLPLVRLLGMLVGPFRSAECARGNRCKQTPTRLCWLKVTANLLIICESISDMSVKLSDCACVSFYMSHQVVFIPTELKGRKNFINTLIRAQTRREKRAFLVLAILGAYRVAKTGFD
ncbi:hypothetical protein M0804_013321 [Polistes exclamans]|nr:hypothetical protein M0804_013321 [Polistes exclamans]